MNQATKRRAKGNLIILIALLLTKVCTGQEWAVDVKTPSGQAGSGSIVMVDGVVNANGWKQGLIITANHVVDKNTTGITIGYENKLEAREAKVIAREPRNDLAILVALVPATVDAVPIAERAIKEGDKVAFVGRNKRRYEGKASVLCYANEAWTDAVSMPGDSGGAALLDEKLVGVISGGMRWAPGNVKKTWPCRTANLDAIKEIIEKAEPQVDWQHKTQTEDKELKYKQYKAGDAKEKNVTQIILFTADWCQPCKQLKKEISKYEKQLLEAGVSRLVLVDVDVNSKFTKANNVTAYPTTMLIRNGNILVKQTGGTANALTQKIKQALQGK